MNLTLVDKKKVIKELRFMIYVCRFGDKVEDILEYYSELMRSGGVDMAPTIRAWIAEIEAEQHG